MDMEGVYDRENTVSVVRLLAGWFGDDARLISEEQSQWVLRHVPNYRLIYRDRLGQRIAFRMGILASPGFPCVLYLNTVAPLQIER